MSTIFFSVGMSLDGFIAGPNGGPDNPLGDNGPQIHEWIYRQKNFIEAQQLGEGGETGPDNDLLNYITNRIGANIMGKHMFEEGEPLWPEDLFKTPVYVLTHEERDPWVQKGETTFYFINDGIESALKKAREAAGEKDIRISGGASTIQQFLNAGVIDEGIIHISPVLLGKGVRLFERLDSKNFSIDIVKATASDRVTHLHCKINNK